MTTGDHLLKAVALMKEVQEELSNAVDKIVLPDADWTKDDLEFIRGDVIRTTHRLSMAGIRYFVPTAGLPDEESED